MNSPTSSVMVLWRVRPLPSTEITCTPLLDASPSAAVRHRSMAGGSAALGPFLGVCARLYRQTGKRGQGGAATPLEELQGGEPSHLSE
jgi:hypothetical protein